LHETEELHLRTCGRARHEVAKSIFCHSGAARRFAVNARSRSTSRTDQGATTMRRIFAILVALTLGAGSQTAFAQSGLVDGEITRVDQSTNKITLRHGPIKKLGMDQGMTMIFSAKDAAMLNGVKAGDKVKFDAERVNGQFTVTRIEKTK